MRNVWESNRPKTCEEKFFKNICENKCTETYVRRMCQDMLGNTFNDICEKNVQRPKLVLYCIVLYCCFTSTVNI